MINFRVFSESICGISHRKKNLPCQDHSGNLEFDNVQMIAVADGHGGSNYFRSQIGSKLAINTAFTQAMIFCKEIEDSEEFSDNGIKNFLHSIYEQWLSAVKKDWYARLPNIFEEPRWQYVDEEYKNYFMSTDTKISESFIPEAYGTTLICAISIGKQILIVQIGDGSCVVLQRNGEFKNPVPIDPNNFLNVTSSLCEKDALQKFRYVVLDNKEDYPLSPIAIFLSTDGVDDCYPHYENQKYLYNLYGNIIIENIIEKGFCDTEKELRETFLESISDESSHDDISLSYMMTENIELLKNVLAHKN